MKYKIVSPLIMFLTLGTLIGCGSGPKIASVPKPTSTPSTLNNSSNEIIESISLIETEPTRRWTITGRVMDGASPDRDAIVSVYSMTEVAYLIGDVRVNASGVYSILINDAYTNGARIKVCAVSSKAMGDCEMIEVLAGERTVSVPDLIPMNILSKCTITGPELAVYGRGSIYTVDGVNVPNSDRLQVVKRLKVGVDYLTTASYSVRDLSELQHSWTFKILGSAMIEYTLTDSTSGAQTKCTKPIVVDLPPTGLNIVYKSLPAGTMDALDAAPALASAVIPFIDLDSAHKNSSGAYDKLAPLLSRTDSTYWGAQIDGYIWIPVDGTYWFQKDSDTEMEINIGGHVFGDKAGTLDGGAVPMSMKKGLHPIRIKYVQTTGNYKLRLMWRRPGVTTYSTVANNYFFRK